MWPSSLGMLIGPSPYHCSPIGPTPLKCENVYLVLALGKETAVQAVVGSIVWAFGRLKKPRCWEMSARGYALDSVCPQISFFFPDITNRLGPGNWFGIVGFRYTAGPGYNESDGWFFVRYIGVQRYGRRRIRTPIFVRCIEVRRGVRYIGVPLYLRVIRVVEPFNV